MIGPRHYTAKEAGDILGIPAARIREWRVRGLVVSVAYVRGPAKKTGYVPVYRLQDLQQMADQYLKRKRHADQEESS